MRRLPTTERARILRCLIEGNSIASTCRLTGAAKLTVLRLLNELGPACMAFTDRFVSGISSAHVEIDEIWSFCYSKQKNVSPENEGVLGYGNVWTFVAIDSTTKLVVSWLCGHRTEETTKAFLYDLASRIDGRTEVSADGFPAYIYSVGEAFEGRAAFGAVDKQYAQNRYVGAIRTVHAGEPKHISTSLIERQNLTMRMSNRRLTRKTNGFSKKLENHVYQLAINFVYYNFCRIHSTIKTTPAIAAQITDYVWTLEDVADIAMWSDLRVQ